MARYAQLERGVASSTFIKLNLSKKKRKGKRITCRTDKKSLSLFSAIGPYKLEVYKDRRTVHLP